MSKREFRYYVKYRGGGIMPIAIAGFWTLDDAKAFIRQDNAVIFPLVILDADGVVVNE